MLTTTTGTEKYVTMRAQDLMVPFFCLYNHFFFFSLFSFFPPSNLQGFCRTFKTSNKGANINPLLSWTSILTNLGEDIDVLNHQNVTDRVHTKNFRGKKILFVGDSHMRGLAEMFMVSYSIFFLCHPLLLKKSLYNFATVNSLLISKKKSFVITISKWQLND